MIRPSILVLAVALSAAPLVACSGGSSSTEITTQTTGQRLIDLKRALDAGVITEREYEAKRRDILRGG